MNNFKNFFLYISVGCVLFFSNEGFSNSLEKNYLKGLQTENFEVWKQNFYTYAHKNGVSKSTLDDVVPNLKFLDNVLKSDKKQSEFLLTFWDYVDKAVTKERIAKGRKFLNENKAFLKDIETQYGVPASYLVAFWGLETNFGTFKGNIKTLDALATLSFDKRRRKFFTKELITLLELIQYGEQTEFYGSWAGAFGNFQFMPTTYKAYALDADGDNKKDVINSLPDAFYSAANYLSSMGWKGDSWGREVKLPKKMNWEKINKIKTQTIYEWQKLGFMPMDLKKWQKSELDYEARLVMPMGSDGPIFLVYKNFDLIMRWNNSTLYALAVGILSSSLQDENFNIKSKRSDVRFSREDIKKIQTGLKNKKIYMGKIDGILGKQTKKSIIAYQKIKKLPQDGYPSQQLVQFLLKEK